MAMGYQDSTTYVDAAYRQVLGNVSLGGKPYMMPVSPWFFLQTCLATTKTGFGAEVSLFPAKYDILSRRKD